MAEQTVPYRWAVLALLFLNIFITTVSMNCMPPLFQEISRQMPLSKAQMGTVMGMLTLASLFVAPLGGIISDRYGSRWALGLASLLVAFAGAARGYASSVSGLTICMFFIGAGMAVIGPNMPKAIGMWFPRHEVARTTGICLSAMGIGGAVAMGTASSYLSPAFGGWRNTLLVIGCCVFIMGILWIMLFKDRDSGGATEKKKHRMFASFKNILRVKEIWLLSIFYGLNMVSLMSVISLLPLSLTERGIERSGQLVSVMLGTTVIFNILGGVLSDRAGKRKPFLIISSFVFGLCILTFASLSGVSLLIALIIAGAAMGTIAPVLMIIPVEIEKIGTENTATAIGIIFMIGNTGGFIGPVISGKLMDVTGSHWAGFIFMAAALIAAAGSIVPLRETGRKK
jgi:cyanate permease